MTELRHASFFSGIGGFDLGFERAGFRVVSHSEVKPFACAVLETHWPGIPNLGDLNAICPDGEGDHECEIPKADVWSGGFPCSDFSIMGKRKGLLGGNRSSLGLVFLDLVRRHRPPFVVLENVPGLLSSHEGRDLGLLLDTLVRIGYGWSFRVLDARNFGLPQARRRLFVVASTDPRDAGAVLDDSTDRGLAPTSVGGPGGAALAGGHDGANRDPSIVIGPTYAPRSDAVVRTDGTTFPLTPANYQYVIDEPVVVDTYGTLSVGQRRGFTSTLTPPDARHRNAHDQYVIEEPVVLAGVFPKRREQRSPSRRDGSSYTLTPGVIPKVVEPDDLGRGGAPGDGGRGSGARADGRSPSTPAGAPGENPLGRAGTAGPGPEDHADRMRATPGVPGRLDDPESGGAIDLGPSDLDAARWHVLGRTCPVPIVEWIGAGVAAVIRRGRLAYAWED